MRLGQQHHTRGPGRSAEGSGGSPSGSAAFVNGLREGWTAERPFEDGDCILQELRGEGAVKERLSVDAELALVQRELERVEAEARATAVAAAAAASLDLSEEGSSASVEDAVAAAVQRHMVELGMSRCRLQASASPPCLFRASGAPSLPAYSQPHSEAQLRSHAALFMGYP